MQGLVPDNRYYPVYRITSPDVKQGPVMWLPAISTLPIQKAGYAGQVLSEIRREGMVHVGELRELIVRPCSNRAVVVTGPARLLNGLGRYR